MALCQQLGYKKRKETSGIGGQIYEIELSMLLLLHGIENANISRFYLASNMEEAGDFDDAVFKYHYTDDFGMKKSKIIFLQAKHKETIEREEKRITIDTLLSQSHKGEFILRKYLSSYSKIKSLFFQLNNHPVFSGQLDDCELIIYTNARLNTDKCKEHIVERKIEPNHVLNVQESSSYYQLVGTKEIIKALEPSLDYEILVKELTQTVREKSLDMNKSIFNDYHLQLNEKVIERKNVREGMFRKEFLETNQDFIKSIFQEFQKKKGAIKSVDDLKSCLEGMTIQLPEKFGNFEENDLQIPLPNELFEEKEITTFLSRLKLFVSQPNERRLGEILQEKVRSTYNLEPFDNAVFSDVKEKIQKWWREDEYYLTKENKFFQESAKICIWFDVRPPTELFTGRSKELVELHNKICRSQETVTVISQMTSVSGLGGIGKTELARRYIDEFSKNFHNNIIWINAENKITLTEGFVRLAKDKLNMNVMSSDGKRKSIESIVDGVYQFFSRRKCLFVFDNAVNTKEFTEFLPLRSLKPSDQKPYILITSRDKEWGVGIDVMDLFVLELTDAVNLVKNGLNIQDEYQDEGIEELVQILQCFPLAIRQSIAYIKNGNYMISDYLDEYEKNKKTLLQSNIFYSITNDYIKTTFTTWKITIKRITEDASGELALQILSIMAYIAPDNISRDLFFHLSEDQNDVISAVHLLVKFCIINAELDQTILNIHRLVQEVTRIEIDDQNQQLKLIQDTFDLFKHTVPFNYINNTVVVTEKKRLLPHLDEFLVHVENWMPKQSNRLMVLSYVYNFWEKRKHANLKDKYLSQLFEWIISGYFDYEPRRSITIMEKLLEFNKTRKKHDGSYIDKIVLLGNMYASAGDYQKQNELHEEALDMSVNLYGPEAVEIVPILENLSDSYGYLGNPEKQKELLERALTINEKTHGNNIKTSNTLELLAETYEGLGNLQKTKDYLERVLKYKEVHFGENDFNVVGTLEQLASVCRKLGNPQRQKECLLRIIQINNEHHSKDTLEIAKSQQQLAFAYGDLQEFPKMIQHMETVLKIKENYYGNDSFHLVTALDGLGVGYGVLMNFEKQQELLERSLKIKEKAFGNNNFFIVNTLDALANAYEYLEKWTEQIELLERTLKIKEGHYGKENFNLIDTLLKISKVYKNLGDFEEQKKCLERALKIAESHYNCENPNTIKILEALGNAYGNLEKYEKEKELLERVLEMKENYFGAHDFGIAQTLTSLVNVYGKFEENVETRRKLLDRAVRIVETSQHSNNVEVANALSEIGSAYGRLGDVEKRKELIKQAYFKAPEEPSGLKNTLKEWIESLNKET